MRKYLALTLALLLILSLFGCQRETVRIEKPVNFYYRNAEIRYGSTDGVIGALPCEGAGYENNLLGLLNRYLQNTDAPAFLTTFPTGSQLIRITVEENVAELQMNNLFARTTGLDLTLACASLSLTVMELTQTDTVIISAVNASLDGADSVTMTAETLLLLDLHTEETEN